MAKPKYEGSKLDEKRDRAAAKKAGVPLKKWEGSKADRKIDTAEQKKLDAKKKAAAKAR